MPSIYRLQCTACGKAPGADGTLAGWVTTDGREGGQILPDGYLALRLDSGEFKPLPHPAEASTLQRLGFTWAEASRQSRLFRVTFKICCHCGALHEEPQHHDLQTGCLAATISIPITIMSLKFGFGRSWGSSLFSSYGVMLGIMGLVPLGNWLRWRKQNIKLKLVKCAQCRADDFITLPKACRRVLMCSHCQTQNLHCNSAGIS